MPEQPAAGQTGAGAYPGSQFPRFGAFLGSGSLGPGSLGPGSLGPGAAAAAASHPATAAAATMAAQAAGPRAPPGGAAAPAASRGSSSPSGSEMRHAANGSGPGAMDGTASPSGSETDSEKPLPQQQRQQALPSQGSFGQLPLHLPPHQQPAWQQPQVTYQQQLQTLQTGMQPLSLPQQHLPFLARQPQQEAAYQQQQRQALQQPPEPQKGKRTAAGVEQPALISAPAAQLWGGGHGGMPVLPGGAHPQQYPDGASPGPGNGL